MGTEREDVRAGYAWAGALGVLTALSLFVLSGCVEDDGSSLPFSHKRHVEDEDLKCAHCHAGATKGEKAGMPTAKVCLKCHEGLDAKKPPEHRMQTYLVNGELPAARHVTKLIEDVKFSHKAHADARVECATCHKDVGHSKAITSRLRIGMKDCADCHAKTKNVSGLKNNCAYCHKTITRDSKPQNHAANWHELHGKALGFMTKDSAERCQTCHTQEWCLRCHRIEAPRNHTNYWRDRGHNVVVELDRQACRTCHTGDFCIRCHRMAAPIVLARKNSNHRPDTNPDRCASCHFEGNGRSSPHRNRATTNCLQCHRIR